MLALQSIILERGEPARVCDIEQKISMSGSGVRSHLRHLIRLNYVCCISQAKIKQYVPASLWMEDEDADPDIVDLDDQMLFNVGGVCDTDGCDNGAEDVYNGKYLCRDCIIGVSLEDDLANLKNCWLNHLTPGSPSAEMEMALNTHSHKK